MNGSPLTICPSQSVPRGYLFLHTVHDGQNFHNFVLHLYLSSWMANSEAYGVFFFIPGFFFSLFVCFSCYCSRTACDLTTIFSNTYDQLGSKSNLELWICLIWKSKQDLNELLYASLWTQATFYYMVKWHFWFCHWFPSFCIENFTIGFWVHYSDETP